MNRHRLRTLATWTATTKSHAKILKNHRPCDHVSRHNLNTVKKLFPAIKRRPKLAAKQPIIGPVTGAKRVGHPRRHRRWCRLKFTPWVLLKKIRHRRLRIRADRKRTRVRVCLNQHNPQLRVWKIKTRTRGHMTSKRLQLQRKILQIHRVVHLCGVAADGRRHTARVDLKTQRINSLNTVTRTGVRHWNPKRNGKRKPSRTIRHQMFNKRLP